VGREGDRVVLEALAVGILTLALAAWYSFSEGGEEE
jgi:hypothetical protein